MKKITIIIFILLLLVSCSVNISKVPDKYAKDVAEKMTYVKDHKTGLCFGVIASRKTARPNQSGLGIVCVPCDQVRNYLVE